jgi:hypothetical protein
VPQTQTPQPEAVPEVAPADAPRNPRVMLTTFVDTGSQASAVLVFFIFFGVWYLGHRVAAQLLDRRTPRA